MKYRVNSRRRKFQFINSGTNLLKNLIWTIAIWSPLMIPFEFYGWFLVRLYTNKNHINDLKIALRTVLIGLLFHSVSYHMNIVLQNVKNLILFSKNCVNFLRWWTSGGVWKEHWWFLTIDCCIWNILNFDPNYNGNYPHCIWVTLMLCLYIGCMPHYTWVMLIS